MSATYENVGKPEDTPGIEPEGTHNLKVTGSNPVRDLNLSIGLCCAVDPFDCRSHRGAQSASAAR